MGSCDWSGLGMLVFTLRRGSLFLLLAGLLSAASAFSQTCEEEAAARRGGWLQGSDAGGNGSAITAKNKAQVRLILDGLAALVKQAYPDPVGSQGKVYRNYGLQAAAGSRDAAYELTANFKGYGCDKRKNPGGEVHMLTETATWLYVQVNSFRPGNSNIEYPQHFLSPDDDTLLTLQPPRILRTPPAGYPARRKIDASLPASITALPNFTHEGAYDSWDHSYNTRRVWQTVFITPDDRPPYDPVSIGEFLNINEERLQKYISANEQYGGVEGHRTLLDRIPELRRRYQARLSEPARIASFSWNERSLAEENPFVGEEGGYMLCRRSPRYNSREENHRPRFIVVSWSWQPEVPYSVKVHEAIRNNLDFAALRNMLVK